MFTIMSDHDDGFTYIKICQINILYMNSFYVIFTSKEILRIWNRISENKVNHPKQTKKWKRKKRLYIKDWTIKYKIWLVGHMKKRQRRASLKKNIRKVSKAQKYRSLEFLPESIIIYKKRHT